MKIENNNIVTMSYSAYDNNTGVLLESNINTQPLQFIIGKEQIVPGLESEILGLNTGSDKEFVLEAKNAYGDRKNDAFKRFPIKDFKGLELKKGMTLVNQDQNGKQIFVKVAGFDREEVDIDFNHPLSGKDLKFQVSILEVRKATQEELDFGKVINNNDSCGCNTGCGCH